MMSALSPPTEKAVSAPGTRDVTVTSATAAIEASASPRKPRDCDRFELLETGDLAGGVARERQRQFVAGDAAAVVGDGDPADAAAVEPHLDVAGAGIEAVLHQFLHNRSRPLDHLAGGDLADEDIGQWPDRAAGGGRHGSIIGRACTAFPASALAYHPRSFPGFRVVRRVVPRDSHAPPSMDGINWLDLFRAADRFLIAIVEQNVILLYAILFAIFFAETGLVVMAFLPGDSLLFVAGAVSASPVAQSEGLNVHVLVVVITLGAVLGNTLNYYIGRWLGKKVYDGTISWINQDALRKTHDFYERHGGKTVTIARFIPIVRTFAPLVAGSAGMEMHRFQFFNVLGAVIWVTSLVYGGYLFGNLPIVRDNLGLVLFIGIAAAAGPVLLAGGLRLLRMRRA